MGYFEGLLGGFQGRKSEVEKQNYERALQSGQREQAIFSHLLSSDDPEIQSLALTGLLESANPKKRKGGLRGWMGELEQSPYLSQVQALLQTPVTEQRTFQLPGEATGLPGPIPGMAAVTPTIQQTPGAAPAGMPATALVDTPTRLAGTPPPQTYTQPPPTPYSVTRPRQAFLSPEAKYRQQAIGKAQGDVEGEYAGLVATGMDPAEARRLLQLSYERRIGGGAAGQTYAEGEITPDPTSPTGFSQTLYLRADPTKTFKQPAMDPTKQTTRFFGQDLESIARELYGRPVAQLSQAEVTNVNTTKQQREVSQAGAVATSRTTAQALAEAAAPLSRMDAIQATQSLRDDWFKVSAPQEALKRQLSILSTADQAIRRGDVGAGSEAIIVTFEKMLDSLSVVRESEYLRPAFNQSLYDRVAGYLSTLREGGARMTPEVLGTYVRLAREIGQATQADYNAHRVAIERTARTAGLDPANVFGTMMPASAATPPPAVTPTRGAAPTATAPPAPTGTSLFQVGEKVLYQGKTYIFRGLLPDGNADLEAIP